LSEINGIDVPDPGNLNLSTGVAKTMMDKIVDYKIREKALDTARKDQEEEFISRRQEIFNNCSKMTAGVAFNAGNLCLNGKVHEKVREQHNNRQQKLADAEKKRKDEHIKLQSKVDAIRKKNSDSTKWNASDLQTMVSWFKRPGDSKLPQGKDQLLRPYLLTCNRSEQERNCLKEGKQPVINDDATAAEGGQTEVQPAVGNNDSDEGRVIEALLQIGTEV